MLSFKSHKYSLKRIQETLTFKGLTLINHKGQSGGPRRHTIDVVLQYASLLDPHMYVGTIVTEKALSLDLFM